MAETRIEDLVTELKALHAANLESVVLCSAGTARNVLVVLKRVAPGDLQLAHKAVREWVAAGNPMPIYFTLEEITDSSDVFPIEFIDMSRAHLVLAGADPFDGLKIETQNLRHQLEYELRSKLLRLRTLYIPASRDPRRLARLMVESLNDFCVLFRHTLELLGEEAVFDMRECITRLCEKAGLSRQVFWRILDYSNDDQVLLDSEIDATFASYLVQLQKVIEIADAAPEA